MDDRKSSEPQPRFRVVEVMRYRVVDFSATINALNSEHSGPDTAQWVAAALNAQHERETRSKL